MLSDLKREYDAVTKLMSDLVERHPELADEMVAAQCGMRTADWLLAYDEGEEPEPDDMCERGCEGSKWDGKTVAGGTFERGE